MRIVKGQGFVDFCETLNPNYQVPCPTEFEDSKSQLQLKLQSIAFVALTADMWPRKGTSRWSLECPYVQILFLVFASAFTKFCSRTHGDYSRTPRGTRTSD